MKSIKQSLLIDNSNNNSNNKNLNINNNIINQNMHLNHINNNINNNHDNNNKNNNKFNTQNFSASSPKQNEKSETEVVFWTVQLAPFSDYINDFADGLSMNFPVFSFRFM